jgi:hypothetical protein
LPPNVNTHTHTHTHTSTPTYTHTSTHTPAGFAWSPPIFGSSAANDRFDLINVLAGFYFGVGVLLVKIIDLELLLTVRSDRI